MKKNFLIYMILISGAPWFAAPAAAAEQEDSEDNVDPPYVVREEKVINFETGKVEVEKVIEFPELEILPELARPVEIIIPRTKPDFSKMPLTIYNNEPSPYLPEEYKLRYYRRVPVRDVPPAGLTSSDVSPPPAENESGEEGRDENGE
jgi:hypothetical protein